jgi:hypothetical protein
MSSRNQPAICPDRFGEAVEVGGLRDIDAGMQRIAQLDIGQSRRGDQDQHGNGQQVLAGLQAGQAVLQANDLIGRTVQVQSAQGLTASGVVSAVNLQAGTPSITVNGQSYDLSQVLSISAAQTQSN